MAVVTGVECPSSAPMTGSDWPADAKTAGIGVAQVVQPRVGNLRRLAQLDPGVVDVRAVSAAASGEQPFRLVAGLRAHLGQQLPRRQPTAGRDARSSAW